MKTKRIIACIISFILFTVCIPFTATAKVIEPEVVKTEKWTTSYYIDDDIDTLYPYIQCEADIYNDGTIKLYMWNTHEWDGFATVSHTATIIQTAPMQSTSMTYNLLKNGSYIDDSGTQYAPIRKEDFSNMCDYGSTTKPQFPQEYSNVDMSYFPSSYRCGNIDGGDMPTTAFGSRSDNKQDNFNVNVDTVFSVYYCWYDTGYKCWRSSSSLYSTSIINVNYPRYSGYLPNMDVGNKKYVCTFVPKTESISNENFRLFGHDITITPELLSGNIVATPSDDGYKTITYNNGSSSSRIKTDTDISDIQKYIDELEAENALLRQENTELKNRINLLATGTYGDVNGDQVVDVQDAQIILAYYTERDVAKKSVPDLVTFGLKFGKE